VGLRTLGTPPPPARIEFVDHPLAVKFFLRDVMLNVQPDQTYQKFLMFHSRHFRLRCAKLDNIDARLSYLMTRLA
jgi:hypothetical protein